MKTLIDFIMQHILRIGRAKDGGEQIVDSLNSDAAPSTVTLRTYPPGSDPVHDRIEFHLTKSDTTPSGFSGPISEDEIRAAFGEPPTSGKP